MILIRKNKEPIEWTNYCSTPGVGYQSIPALVESLLIEQGYICAYCMRRIPHKDKLYKRDGSSYSLTSEDHRVEHIKSREHHQALELKYSNMVICCPGHIGDKDHCDRAKSSNDISFSPLDSSFIDTLSYSSDGRIRSSNPTFNSDIEKILNLNTKLLVLNRKSVLDEVIKMINSYHKSNRQWSKNILRAVLDKYENMHQEDGKQMYYPYCGIIIWYLRRKLKQLP